MRYKLADLIDVPRLQVLMDAFHAVTNAPSAILDTDGTILTATAWQNICTCYHRVNPECQLRCHQSDAYISSHLGEGSQYVLYECANGLVDVASPIIVDNMHVGTVFTGQFLLHEPDLAYFRSQAQQFGFDEEEYLAALKQVPVVEHERIEPILRYLSLFTSMLAEMGYQRLQQLETQRRLQESEERFRAIADYTYDWESWLGTDGTVRWINPAVERLTGYTVEECLAMANYPLSLIHPEDRASVTGALRTARANSSGNDLTFRILHRTGDIRWMAMSWQTVYASNGDSMGLRTSIRDFTDRKRAEEMTLRLGRILDRSSNEIFVFRADDLRFVQVNQGAQQNLGYTMNELSYLTAVDIKPEISSEQFATLIAPLFDGTRDMIVFETVHQRKNGTTYPVDVRLHLSRNEEIPVFVAIIQDITERKQAEQERMHLQEQIIQTQKQSLRELSTPLIPISDTAVVLPLIGAIDSMRAQQIMETLLEGVVSQRATIAILDITGVQVVDTRVASALIQAAQAVKLLGAQVVLTGIRPDVAQTLVHLGADLSGMVTLGTLQSGIGYALRRVR